MDNASVQICKKCIVTNKMLLTRHCVIGAVESSQCFLVLSEQELELLPAKDLHQNVYIKHPVSIEQYLMEGSYNKASYLSPNFRWMFRFALG